MTVPANQSAMQQWGATPVLPVFGPEAGPLTGVSQVSPLPVQEQAPQTLSISGFGSNLNDMPIPATDVGAYRGVSVHVLGTFSATYTFEGSNDGVNWYGLDFVDQNAPAGLYKNQSSGSSVIFIGNLHCRYFRVRLSAYASGQVQVVAWFTRMAVIPHTVATSTGNAAAAPADGTGNPTTILLGVLEESYNGTTWDRWRNNTDLTLLASAARTAQTACSDQVNYNGHGVRVVLSVTVASGTGGLQVQIQGKDSISGNYYQLNSTPTAVTATGTFVYDLYPVALGAAANGITQVTNAMLARTWRINVAVGDSSSYTYSVSAVTLL